MENISPSLSFYITSVACLLLFFVMRMNPERKKVLSRQFSSGWVQCLATITVVIWLITVLVTIPTDSGNALTSFLHMIKAASPEHAASVPFALHDVKGQALQHVLPTPDSTQRAFFIVVKRTLIALIASGVTAFAFLLVLSGLVAMKTKTTISQGMAMLKTLSWRGVLITGIALWVLLNWTLFLWPTRHLLGTMSTGVDTLLWSLESLVHVTPLFLLAWMIWAWMSVRNIAPTTGDEK